MRRMLVGVATMAIVAQCLHQLDDTQDVMSLVWGQACSLQCSTTTVFQEKTVWTLQPIGQVLCARHVSTHRSCFGWNARKPHDSCLIAGQTRQCPAGQFETVLWPIPELSARWCDWRSTPLTSRKALGLAVSLILSLNEHSVYSES